MPRLAVLTSGGDASGMNAAVRAVVRSALWHGWQPFGVYQGYAGLIEGNINELHARSVADIIQRGGTILQSSRSEEFMSPAGREKAVQALRRYEIEHLIVIGGNGSLAGAWELERLGIYCIGIPATIDNDVAHTRSIGFDTAVNTVLDAINRVRDTASSHGRTFIIEVMGHSCGELALAAGLAGGAESILIPECPVDIEALITRVNQGIARGKAHSIIVVAETVYPLDKLRQLLVERTGHDCRIIVLGHVQRGGTPGMADRLLATHMGHHAVELLI
ncbi:MAG: ATP-dependent 6-phosphofructokinase, partial [Syntrophomonadaceae bacterium]|nr:ATP-dependent 6-phosphofructokinase [Syntrophomonadaceae bacterium]